MNKLKKTLALLLSLVMILSLLPAAAFAEDELPEEVSEVMKEEARADVALGSVAKIGDTGYSTLAAALADAQTGDTITLLANVQEHELNCGGTLTIDLDGHHIDGGNSWVLFYNGELTITGGGYITSSYPGPASTQDPEATIGIVNGRLTLRNGAEIRNTSSQGTAVDGFGCDIVIDGGSINSANKAITGYAGKSVTVSGGTIQCSSFVTASGFFGSGTGYTSVTVTGGTFNIDPSAYVDTNNYKVSGSNGTYTVQAKAVAEPVAQIGDEKYETLEAAVAAVENNETITLVNDITFASDYSVQVWGDKYFNLDLNGHTITTNSGVGKDLSNMGYTASALCFAIGVDSAVTVSNGSIVTAYGAGVYAAGTPVTLEDLTITASTVGVQSTKEYSSAVRLTSGATVVINSGSYSGANGAYAIAVSNSGGVVTVNGGTFNGDIFFSASTDAGVDKSITINGGNFTGNFVNPKKGTLVITGGNFTADPTAYVPEGYEVVSSTVAGYTYTVQPVVTYVAEVNGTQYTTLAAAFAAANATEGEVTITLLADCDTGDATISAPLALTKAGTTLDLNGKTITVNNNFSFVMAANNITVKDGSIYSANNTAKKTGYNSYILVIGGKAANDEVTGVKVENITTHGGLSVGGSSDAAYKGIASGVVLENCNITSGDYYAVCSQNNSTVTIKSGTYIANSNYSGSRVLQGDFKGADGPEGTIIVTGGNFQGTINSTNSAWVALKGGIYTVKPSDSLVADGYDVVANTDDSTNDTYLWTVQGHVHSYVYDNPTVFWAKINGKMTAVFTYACSCGEVERKIVSENADTTIVASNENPGVNASYNDYETVYDAYDGHENKVTRTETVKFEVYFENISGSVDSYNWGEICRLTSSDNLPADWYIVEDGGAEILAAVNKSVYSFPVTEDVTIRCTPHNGSQTDYHDRAISAKLESTEAGKATFQTKWSLPDGATVKSVKVYRGYTNGAAAISQDTLRQYGTAMNVNLLVRNGDYKLNLSNLTPGTYQYVMIEITYRTSGLDVEDDLVFTSEVQRVQVQQ